MRTVDGVAEAGLPPAVTDWMLAEGLAERRAGRICPTLRGFLMADRIAARIVVRRCKLVKGDAGTRPFPTRAEDPARGRHRVPPGGDAVGSRTVTRRHDLGLSPATVRNVMADLEEMGLLEQRHTSAGRVPTPIGLRLFIDSHAQGPRAHARGERGDPRAHRRRDARRGRPARVAPALRSHAPRRGDPRRRIHDQQRLERIEFVPLRDGKLIAVLVTTDGRIENRLVLDDVDATRLERIHNYLNQLLSGMTLDEVRDRVIRELGEDKNRYDEAIAAALRLGHAVFVSGRTVRRRSWSRVRPTSSTRRSPSASAICCARSRTKRR